MLSIDDLQAVDRTRDLPVLRDPKKKLEKEIEHYYDDQDERLLKSVGYIMPQVAADRKRAESDAMELQRERIVKREPIDGSCYVGGKVKRSRDPPILKRADNGELGPADIAVNVLHRFIRAYKDTELPLEAHVSP